MINQDPLAPTRMRSQGNHYSKTNSWTAEEDDLLRKIVVSSSDQIDWKSIASKFPLRTPQQVSERWKKVINPNLVKGSWTRREDEIIMSFVAQHGPKHWKQLSNLLPGRAGKQCRERWMNQLNPNINHSVWTQEEDLLLLNLHAQFGNKWVKIASQMPGRSDNSVKNRWNSTVKKMNQNSNSDLSKIKPIYLISPFVPPPDISINNSQTNENNKEYLKSDCSAPPSSPCHVESVACNRQKLELLLENVKNVNP